MASPSDHLVLHVTREAVDVLLDALDTAARDLAYYAPRDGADLLARSVKMTTLADSIRTTLHLEKVS